MRISDWSSDVCSSDLGEAEGHLIGGDAADVLHRGAGDLGAGGGARHLLVQHVGHAGADDVEQAAGAAGADPLPRLGGDTRAWLELQTDPAAQVTDIRPVPGEVRSEEHTSELQSLMHIT